ncbi:MAG: phosphotransferase [Actinomycetota bacterium]
MIGEREVREVIERHLGTSAGTVRAIPGGWGHFTFVVDERWVMRFARTEAIAEQDRIERLVLPVIETSVSFRVPRFEYEGVVRGLSYVGYRFIPGRPLEERDVPSLVELSALGQLVHELHSIDTADVSNLLGGGATAAAWQDRYRDLRTRATAELPDVLDQSLLNSVEIAFTRFFDAPFRFDPVVVHGDLGTSHILVDDISGLVGLLDFEAVTIGDPAIDFVGVMVTLGPEVCQAVIDSYQGRVDDGFWERVLGYWWIGSLYAVFHGVATNDPSATESGVEGLSQRLADLSRL